MPEVLQPDDAASLRFHDRITFIVMLRFFTRFRIGTPWPLRSTLRKHPAPKAWGTKGWETKGRKPKC
jgi:hypothetical protein